MRWVDLYQPAAGKLISERMLSPLLVVAVCVVVLFEGVAVAAESGGKAYDVLNRYGFWRLYATLRPPVVLKGGKYQEETGLCWRVGRSRTRRKGQPVTPYPPKEWMKPDFDDSRWLRQPLPYPVDVEEGDKLRGAFTRQGWMHPVEVALVCARGKFGVTDVKEVKRLNLVLEYRGGVIVYLNGREVARKDLTSVGNGFDVLAKDYPVEASRERVTAEVDKMRVRRLDVDLPLSALVKGTNVLAIEVHRSAMVDSAEVLKRRLSRGGRRLMVSNGWNRCALLNAVLTCEGKGVVANIMRPTGVQVWTSDLLNPVLYVDYGDPFEKGVKVKMVAPRGGWGWGHVVISSDKDVRSPRVEVGPIEGSGAILPSSAVRVYYARMDGNVGNVNFRYPPVWGPFRYLKWSWSLQPEAPSVVKVRKGVCPKGYRYRWGAVQDVWIGVRVPSSVPAGRYEGVVRVSVEGRLLRNVPLVLQVGGYVLPPVEKRKSFIDFIQSPESLALHYGVKMWSKKHWNLIERSFEMLGWIGADTVYIPLITPTHLGNSVTMAVWKKGSGGYEYDISRVERYLDAFMKYNGRPKVVCFVVWDNYLGGKVVRGTGGISHHFKVRKRRNAAGVSVVEGTGEETVKEVPMVGEEAKKLWRPLCRRLTALMRSKGLLDAKMIGIAGDIRPTKEYVDFWKDVWPEAKWVMEGHGRADALYDVPVGYSSSIFGCVYPYWDPDVRMLRGWKRRPYATLFPRRLGSRASDTAYVFYHLILQWNVFGNQNGIGRVTADFFDARPPEMRKKRRGYFHLGRRYPECYQGNVSLVWPWLAPGKEGAVPTTGFVLLQMGMQAAEAQIFIEEQITAGRVSGAEKQSMEALVKERRRYISYVFNESAITYNVAREPKGILLRPMSALWYAGSGWKRRLLDLFDAAGKLQGGRSG